MKRSPLQLAALALAAGVSTLLTILVWEGISYGATWSADSAQFLRHVQVVSSSLVIAGAVLWVALKQSASQEGQLASAVTRLQSQAEHARNTLQLVLDAAPAAFMVVDDDNRVIEANRLARQVHGHALVGEHCAAAFGADTARCVVCPGCTTLQTLEPGTSARSVTDPRTGEIVSIASHAMSLPDGQKATLLVEEIVTAERKLQASLLHQEKMAAFGLIAAGVAHEMGNPLSSIEMHLQLLDDEALSDDDAESVQTLRSETKRLRRTLRELVDFARRRRDAATLVSVESVVRDALRLMRYDRRMSDIEVVVDASPDTPAVHVVEDHLVQVALNLLINALDSMPDGGTLRIDVRGVGDRVALRVRDTGSGMTREALDRCFEPLFTTKAKGKGTGLGLSICKDVIEAAGGRIELHSTEDRGTVAVVTLPAALATERPELEPAMEATS